MLQANPDLIDLRTGQGDYGEQPPSSYHIYFWTIGDSLSPLDVAAQFEQQDTFRTMLEFASPLQRLHLACRRGDEPGARAVLREHPRIIESMKRDDHRAISDAAWNGDARAVALMSELGFDPRTPGHDGGTALHCAAWEGSPETVAVLLRRRDAREHENRPCANANRRRHTARLVLSRFQVRQRQPRSRGRSETAARSGRTSRI